MCTNFVLHTLQAGHRQTALAERQRSPSRKMDDRLPRLCITFAYQIRTPLYCPLKPFLILQLPSVLQNVVIPVKASSCVLSSLLNLLLFINFGQSNGVTRLEQ